MNRLGAIASNRWMRFLRWIRHLLGIREILTRWRRQIDALAWIRWLGIWIRITGWIRNAIHLYLLQMTGSKIIRAES